MRHSAPVLQHKSGGMEWEAAVGNTNCASIRGGCALQAARQISKLNCLTTHANEEEWISEYSFNQQRYTSCLLLFMSASFIQETTKCSRSTRFTPFSASTHRTCIPIYLLQLQRGQNVAPVEGGTAATRLRNLVKSFPNCGFLSFFFFFWKKFGLTLFF